MAKILKKFYTLIMIMRKLLIFTEIFCGLTAFAGGAALIFMNGLGMPIEWLGGIFNSYFWPGFILAVVVGGVNLTAAAFLWKNYRLWAEASATAGFGLLIWILTELYIIGQPHWLQVFYFGAGILILVLTMQIMKRSEVGK